MARTDHIFNGSADSVIGSALNQLDALCLQGNIRPKPSGSEPLGNGLGYISLFLAPTTTDEDPYPMFISSV
jgi:hypothetical protein